MRFCSWLCGCWTRRAKGDGGRGGGEEKQQQQSSSSSWNLFIDLKTLEAATDNFSDANLLGRGGFGPVYKGVMGNGQEIAVKKLSLESRQGMREFTNEVRLLLKVQHRNLVSLLGCCASAGQKMLVYPYFPNRSLDHFLFDKGKHTSLDWSKRFEIIVGVAKGLLYLHEESPVKIIHRDIKASNILLDDQLNPKISDFGMARLFQEDATHVNTFKISGTHGYMAPEYALNGYLSAKTDVFSFGVLVLEIVSGRKNLDRHLDEEKVDLLSYTWKLLEAGKALEVVDPSLSNWSRDEAALCIQIGLLCCQAIISDRPDMHTIHLMLSSDSFTLPKPGRPGLRGRIGRWTSTPSSTLTNTNTNSTLTGTDGTKASTLCSIAEDDSRNSISVSFTSEGR
ncbi:cysteine-rich receptor-like protein kinase 44 [Elaeis guineensis]|uniref:Receptor-like protein kinase At4g00960 n=1 Tax=Elaeis guineensis var. tenera TaxID=51953 RepID=A0A6I9QWL1_ELAGV|nr:putative receptor-like protein kinase At4g00960 [Elaeis guineensis]